MSKLGGLINGQDVAFDTHQGGDGLEINWPKVHLEKRLHGGGKIRFPFLGNEPPTYDGMNEEKYYRVVKEVRKTLQKNNQLLAELAKEIVNQLDRFSSGKATSEDAREAAKRFAGYFDLDTRILRAVEEYSDNHLSSYTTIHFNPADHSLIEISQSKIDIIIQKPRRYNSLKRIYPRNYY